MSAEIKSTIATASSWSLFGISLAQINELLQMIALVLTIIATTITVGLWIPKAFRWLKLHVQSLNK